MAKNRWFSNHVKEETMDCQNTVYQKPGEM